MRSFYRLPYQVAAFKKIFVLRWELLKSCIAITEMAIAELGNIWAVEDIFPCGFSSSPKPILPWLAASSFKLFVDFFCATPSAHPLREPIGCAR